MITKSYKVCAGMKLYEQVLEQIKAMIAQGLYRKGDLLPSEKELMDMMGVSRVTVREALRLLSEAGLIETHRGKGSFVVIDASELVQNRTSVQDYQQMFLHSTDARIMLEPVVAAHAASYAAAEELEALERTFSDAGNYSFHAVLMELAHNPIITQWYEELSGLEETPELIRLVPPSKQKSTSSVLKSQHYQIFEAIRNRKPEYAYFHMKEHLEFVRKIYEGYFALFFD